MARNNETDIDLGADRAASQPPVAAFQRRNPSAAANASRETGMAVNFLRRRRQRAASSAGPGLGDAAVGAQGTGMGGAGAALGGGLFAHGGATADPADDEEAGCCAGCVGANEPSPTFVTDEDLATPDRMNALLDYLDRETSSFVTDIQAQQDTYDIYGVVGTLLFGIAAGWMELNPQLQADGSTQISPSTNYASVLAYSIIVSLQLPGWLVFLVLLVRRKLELTQLARKLGPTEVEWLKSTATRDADLAAQSDQHARMHRRMLIHMAASMDEERGREARRITVNAVALTSILHLLIKLLAIQICIRAYWAYGYTQLIIVAVAYCALDLGWTFVFHLMNWMRERAISRTGCFASTVRLFTFLLGELFGVHAPPDRAPLTERLMEWDNEIDEAVKNETATRQRIPQAFGQRPRHGLGGRVKAGFAWLISWVN